MIEELLWHLVDKKYESLSELARVTEHKVSTLTAWHRGQHRMPLRDAELIAKAVGMELALVMRRPE